MARCRARRIDDYPLGDTVGILRGERVADFRLGREAHTAQIWNDNGMVFVKCLGEWRPHVAGVGEAVQHYHRGTVAADADVYGDAFWRDSLDFEIRRKALDAGKSWR